MSTRLHISTIKAILKKSYSNLQVYVSCRSFTVASEFGENQEMNMMKSLAKFYANGKCSLHRCVRTYMYCKRNLGNTGAAMEPAINKGASYLHVIDKWPIVGATIGQLVDAAPDRFGDRLAVVDCAQGIRKTFVEMKNEIDKLATGILALNLERGDRIAIWCPNKYEWILTHLAVSKAGLILVTINPVFQPKEFAYCLQKCGVKALVFPESFKTQNYYEMIKSVIPEVVDSKPGQIKSETFPNFETLIAMSDKDLPGTFNLKEVMNAGGNREKEKLNKLQAEIQFDDVTNIQFTSGTTGKPKAATLTHLAMINNCLYTARRAGIYNYEFRKICCCVPLFHTMATVAVSTNTVAVGTCAVLPSPGYSMDETIKAIEREKCTTIYTTPTILIDFMHNPNFSKTNLTSLIHVGIGGAPCAPELMKETSEKLTHAKVLVGYGATETGLAISTHDINDDITRYGHVGRPMPNTEVKIVDQEGNIVPLGTPGEICVRGYNVLQEYWEDEEKTKEAIKKRWYHTGDIGTLTEEGHLTVIGRLKDMVIRGGENIYPKEIEDYLTSHPKISDVHVFGVPDKRMGEELCAWIKLKTNETITENEVKEFCKGQIAHFKIPRYVRFVTSFPLTAIGKVQKYVMREEMTKSLGQDGDK